MLERRAIKVEINTIFNEDCIKGIRSKIPDESIDLIVTDPPYLIGYKTNYRKTSHKFKTEIANDRLRGGDTVIKLLFHRML